jgi:uncharacterized protein YegP (UPF0339 family)
MATRQVQRKRPAASKRSSKGKLPVQHQRPLTFEVYRDAGKEFRWRLKAGNGEILASAGEGYKAKADCEKGVQRLRTELGHDKLRFEVYEDTSNEQRWRLIAANGQVIANSSQGYKAMSDCRHAIELIKQGAARSAVEDFA